MAYKNIMSTYHANVVYALQNHEDSALLVEHNGELRRVKEFIGYVENITNREEGEMATLKIRFAKNQTVETRAYIDDTIQEKMIVSIWGFFDQTKDEIKFFCKCGMQRVIGSATQCKKFDLRKTYRMGFVELSEVEISPIYMKKEGVREIDKKAKIYAFSGDLSNIENSLENNSVIDTAKSKPRIKFY